MKGRKRSLLPLLFGAFLGSSSWIWLLRAAVSSTVATARGGTETSPHRAQHPHGGIIAPFRSGDPGISLDADALRVLASGHPYRTQVQSADSAGGRGMVVQDVRAPARVVWDRILDFEGTMDDCSRLIFYNDTEKGSDRSRDRGDSASS
jgi:hypothetical protein